MIPEIAEWPVVGMGVGVGEEEKGEDDKRAPDMQKFLS